VIRTEEEYQAALARVEDEEQALAKERERLLVQGVSPEHADIALEPYIAFRMQFLDEIEEYEKLRRGHIDDVENLGGLGRRLVLLRLYRRMTQKELAERLGVSIQQVSRDEKNEYHNAGTDKIQRVLEALGVVMRSSFEFREPISA
jgi:DNA-directed RNA polymerase specialized sigma subunit